MANADSVIVELIAKTEQLDRPIKQSAANFETQANKIVAAAGRMEGAVARSNKQASVSTIQASTQMIRGYTDISQFLQSPSSPFLLPAKQAPIASTAIRGLSLAGTALGGIMGGVVALGVSAAVGALITLILKSKDGTSEVGKLIDKMREQARQAELNALANGVWEQSLDGLIAKTRKLTEETERQLETDAARAGRVLAEEQGRLGRYKSEQAITSQQLANARKELAEAEKLAAEARGRAVGADPSSPEGANAQAEFLAANRALNAAKAQVERLAGRYNELTVVIGQSASAINGLTVQSARIKAEDLSEPIKAKYQAMRAEAEATIKDLDKLAARLAEIDKLEKKAREKPKAAKADNPFGRQVSGQEAAAIARAAGLQVNSVDRNYAKQKELYDSWVKAGKPADRPVAPPGSSAHEGARGKWAIDIQMQKGLTPALLKKIFAAQGINLTKVLPEGQGIFHVEGSRSEAAGVERAEERAAKEANRNEEAYLRDLDALNSKILQLKAQQTGGAEELLELEFAQIDLARMAADRGTRRDLEEGRIDEAKARQLVALNAQVAEEEKNVARLRARKEALDRQDQLQQRSFDYRVADLEYEAEFATSRRAHLDLQLQIVDVLFEARLAHLETLRAQAELAGETQKAADIQAEINRANIEHGQARGRTERQGQGPLGRAAEDATDISDELEQLQLDSINGFTDALTEAIMGTKSLKEAFAEMAQSIIRDLVAMIVKMLVFKAIQAAFGPGFAGGGEVSAAKMAGGGRIVGPGTGTSDSIPIMASAGEFVIRRKVVDKLGAGVLHHINRTGRLPGGYAMGGEVTMIRPSNAAAIAAGSRTSAPVGAPILFDLRGAVMTEDLLRQMNRIASARGAQAGKAAFDASQQAMPKRFDRLQRLGS